MMGLTPRQVDALTLPEMAAMFEGFRQFHSGAKPDEEPEDPSLDAFFAARAEAMAAGNL
jgi:hypothetical protein